MKKLFTLLTLLVAIVTGAWGDVYEWTHNQVFTTLSVTAAKGGSSVSTYTGYTISYTAADKKKYTCSTAVKMESATTLTFTTAKMSSITVGIVLKNGTNYGANEATVKLDNTPTSSAITEATTGATTEDAVYVTITNVEAGEHVISRGSKELGVAYIRVAEVDEDLPVINTQPKSASYMTGSTATALSVVATASKGDLSYQWKSCKDANKTGTANITGETSSTYTPSTASAGTFYYYCTVTDDNGSKDSDVATITVENAAAPGISLSGTSYSTTKGTAVTFTATPTGVPAPTVTWYQSETETNSGGVEKGTGNTYTPDVTIKGTFYYYAIASNSEGNATSEVITLTVTDPNKLVSGNAYYIGENETPVPDESIICNDITMTFVNGKAGESFTESVEDNHINDINSNYQYSISGSSGNNGWKAQFAPTVSGILKVGVIINNNKTFSITNVTSFSYKGFNNKSTDPDDVSKTISGNSFKTGETTTDKLYVEVTINAVAGTEYAFSVAGSKMGFYGFEFTPAENLSATITSAGWATLYTPWPLDFAKASPSGLTAYTATLSDNTVTLTEVQNVQAGTGVVLKGNAGGYTIPVAESSSTPKGDMKGDAIAGTELAAETAYILGKNNAGKAQFFINSEGTIAAGKAYLPVGTNPAKALSVVFANDLTGITNANAAEEAAQPAKRIVNGQLVIEKNGKRYNAAGAEF